MNLCPSLFVFYRCYVPLTGGMRLSDYVSQVMNNMLLVPQYVMLLHSPHYYGLSLISVLIYSRFTLPIVFPYGSHTKAVRLESG